jgi:hypothetical protein
MFHFGDHTAVFPIELVCEGEELEFAIPPSLETAGHEVKTFIAQLSSPITVKTAQPALMKMFQESGETFTERPLALWASDFAAGFFLQPEIRLFIQKLFAKVPLMQNEVSKAPQRDVALCQAQMFEFLKGQSFESYSSIKVPVVKAGDIDAKKICPAAPEVYLEDQEFQSVVKMSKDAFYALGLEKMGEIRKKLVDHESF